LFVDKFQQAVYHNLSLRLIKTILILIYFEYNSLMKQLISQTHLLLSLLLFSSCATNPVLPPSQNSALNSVSDSNAKKEKNYWMQEQFDSFLENEWNPTMKKDKEIQKKYRKNEESEKKEEKHFTLQEFVDKQEAYRKAHPVDDSKSNVRKLNSMPAIGENPSRR